MRFSDKSAKAESFSALQSVKQLGAPSGVELSLEERGNSVTATLRDYEGTPAPDETKPLGTINGRDVRLLGRNKRGKVEIVGKIGGASFQGTIIRQIGKDTYSENISPKRRIPQESRVGF